MLNRAVERYPGYAPAHSMLAFMLLVSGHLNLTYSTGPQLARAAQLRRARGETRRQRPVGASRGWLCRFHAAADR